MQTSRRTILKLILFTCGIFFVSQSVAQQYDTSSVRNQKDVIDLLRKLFKINEAKFDSARSKKKVQFSVVPAAGAAPGGGRAVVTSFNAAFYTGNPVSTSLSTVTFSPWFTFNGKFVIPFRNMVWLPKDFLMWRGDSRFMIYTQYTWGLGGKNDKDKKLLLNYDYLRFYHSLLKKVGKEVFLGAGFNLDFHYQVKAGSDSSHFSEIEMFDYELDEKTVSSGPVLNFMIDTRRNSLNPKRGMYLAADYRFNTEWLGSSSDWQSLLVDFRKYIPFDTRRQDLLAIWTYFWGVTKGKPPYLDLPAIGWDYYNKSGRGFQQNRFRSKRIVYGEVEYRRDISRDGFWGFVVFANLHSASEFQTNDFAYWHPAVGTGLRVKFNKLSRTNISVDCGFSKGYVGVYLTLGEVF